MKENELYKILYDDYVKWKSWGDVNTDDIEKYRIEFDRADVINNCTVLEVGFGEGHFLDWAKNVGHEVFGVEISNELCDAAKKRGHTVFCGDIDVVEDIKFDCIVAFDLVEHLTKVENYNLFLKFNSLLKKDGVIILKFPNGASPFGRLNQYGDLTHRTILTKDSISQFCASTGLTVAKDFNAARSLHYGNRKNIYVFKKMAYFIRDALEIVIGYLYYSKRVPLDPNITVILKKS